MAVSSAGFKPVRKPTWAAEPVRPVKPVRKPVQASVGGGLNQAQQNAQDARNFKYAKPLMQQQQDQRNAPFFAAYAQAHPGTVQAGAPGVDPALAAPAPPAAPAAPGAAAPGPINPFSAAGETAISDRQKATQIALAALGGEEAETQRQFFDPNNPQSRQAELKRQFDQMAGAQKYGQASSGQLYSGSSATEGALGEQDRGFAQANLQNEFQSIMNGIAGRRRQATTDEANDILGITTQTDNAFAGDVENTPIGTGDTAGAAAAARATAPRTAAQMRKDNPAMVAAVKARMRAARKKGK
jgi:hypothetical protein